MSVSPAKENILKKIRQALSHPTTLPFPQSEGAHSVYQAPTDELEIIFAQEFSALQGKFIFCENDMDMHQKIRQLIDAKEWSQVYCMEPTLSAFNTTSDLASCNVSITDCECLVARTGTIVMSGAQASGRTTSVYAPIHICIAYTNQLVYDIKDALVLLKEKYNNNIPSFITFASGPSRTADIEKTLVTGVHGPKEVYLFLIDNTASV